MNCNKNYDIKQSVVDWLYAGDPVPEYVCKIAADLAAEIVSDIEDYRDEISFDWDKDLPDCKPWHIAFDLMTIICFEGESTEAVRFLCRDIAFDERDSFCREHGIPATVLDCIMAWNRNGTLWKSTDSGPEACFPDRWDVPCTELSDWRKELMAVGG